MKLETLNRNRLIRQILPSGFFIVLFGDMKSKNLAKLNNVRKNRLKKINKKLKHIRNTKDKIK